MTSRSARWICAVLLGGAAACADKDSTVFDRPALGEVPASDAGSGPNGSDAGSALRSMFNDDGGTQGEVALVGTGAATSGAPMPAGSSASSNVGSGTTAAEPPASDAGGSSVEQSPCTGCARIHVDPGHIADYQLDLVTPRDLSATTLTFRVRIFNFTGDVSLVGYAASGEETSAEATTGMLSQRAEAGWQDVQLDLAAIATAPADAGNDAVFDKARVVQVGLAVEPGVPSEGAMRATVELDSVNFSNLAALNANFSAGQSGFVLVDSPDATVTEVPE